MSGQADEKKLKEIAKLRTELGEKLSPEVKVTPEKQAEIDAIRNEILNAVVGKVPEWRSSYWSPSGG